MSDQEVIGEITTGSSQAVVKGPDGRFLTRYPHCECGHPAAPIIEDERLVGYYCPECNIDLDHTGIVWVRYGT